MDTLRAFAVEPAKNGGLVVSEQSHVPGRMNDVIGAFSTPADMIAWLAEQYGLTASVANPGDYLVAPADGTCDDEGCPHHGTTHVCIDWIVWGGGDRPVGLNTLVDVKFRSGEIRRNKIAKIWDWTHCDPPNPGDIIAYRIVPASSKAWADHLNDPTVAAAISDHNNRHA